MSILYEQTLDVKALVSKSILTEASKVRTGPVPVLQEVVRNVCIYIV